MALEPGLEKCTDVQRWEDNFARLKEQKLEERRAEQARGQCEAPRFTRPAVSKRKWNYDR